LAIVIVGRAKYTRARAKVRDFARARVYFARPTIAIAKIRDYSQSSWKQAEVTPIPKDGDHEQPCY